ncbi:hypothetical protein [Jannaschia sp. W003]|uniref:hypothetical protein n=1 Tax=Jannaschia sp. W003 TaxID=2867012 RepID=UPI0021A3C7F8|nr:hypothetical protein [Jannaschia sp. W003]UWQ22514.1 hypothetical protein K3554_05680 [Jannaschia sp. W003]
MTRTLAPLAAALLLLAAPAGAQEDEGDVGASLERGLQLLMEGLLSEIGPELDELDGLRRDAQPLLERLQGDLGRVLEGFADLPAYDAPEMLPNGDIIIRRKLPLPEGVEPNPDGSLDL